MRRGGGGGGGGGVVVILGALQRVLALGGHEAGDPVVGIHGAAGSSSSAGRRPDLRVSSRLLPLVSSRRLPLYTAPPTKTKSMAAVIFSLPFLKKIFFFVCLVDTGELVVGNGS